VTSPVHWRVLTLAVGVLAKNAGDLMLAIQHYENALSIDAVRIARKSRFSRDPLSTAELHHCANESRNRTH
jgi:hypothetical protein